MTPLVTVQNALGYNSWPFVQVLGKTLVCAYSRGKEHSISETCRGVYARRSANCGCFSSRPAQSALSNFSQGHLSANCGCFSSSLAQSAPFSFFQGHLSENAGTFVRSSAQKLPSAMLEIHL